MNFSVLTKKNLLDENVSTNLVLGRRDKRLNVKIRKFIEQLWLSEPVECFGNVEADNK